MAYKGLRDFIRLLEIQNELIRITTPVNPELEIAEIVDRISKSSEGGKALLFENNGTNFPLLINAFGSERRMNLALAQKNIDNIGNDVELLFKNLSSQKSGLWDKIKLLPSIFQLATLWPKVTSGKAKCQEVIMGEPDLTKIPILKCWPADGGRFITLPCVITRDPDTGIRNVGMYRMQVFGPRLTGMHWHKHKTGARHFSAYKSRGIRMPVTVVLGGDPAYGYAATAPLPENIDEFLLAGFIRRKKVRLVKCLTNDLDVPADADFIIEGYIDPEEELIWEGPFGDHTGFYSLADWYPKFHITCITHRKDAVYPATIVGIPPMEDAYIGRATERIFLTPMKLTVIPELLDIDLPPAGVAHNLTVVNINKTYAGQAQKVMNAMWGAGQMMFNKILIVTSNLSNIHNYEDLVRQVSLRVDSAQDIVFSKGPMDVLDHSSAMFAYGSKMGIDATAKIEEEVIGEDLKVAELFIASDSLKNRVNLISGIEKVNWSLINKDIAILIAGIRKYTKNSLDEIVTGLLLHEELYRVKFFIFVDAELDIDSLEVVSWYVTANIDPHRDCRIIEPSHEGEVAHLIVDGTRKSAHTDGFQRDWPNPVVSSVETIKRVDELWTSLGLGDFIPSPSLKYIPLQRGKGAVSAEE
jgi:4-hydroxy-3-polyprenylbenzoate decarboxylase